MKANKAPAKNSNANKAKAPAKASKSDKAPAASDKFAPLTSAKDAFGYGLDTSASKIMAALSEKATTDVNSIAAKLNVGASRIRAHFANAMSAPISGVRRNFVARVGAKAYKLTGRTMRDVLAEIASKAPAK
jgi:hypothetical protein